MQRKHDLISDYRDKSDISTLFFQRVFGLKARVFIMNAGQRFSDSEWSRILKVGGLVILNGVVY